MTAGVLANFGNKRHPDSKGWWNTVPVRLDPRTDFSTVRLKPGTSEEAKEHWEALTALCVAL